MSDYRQFTSSQPNRQFTMKGLLSAVPTTSLPAGKPGIGVKKGEKLKLLLKMDLKKTNNHHDDSDDIHGLCEGYGA